ncbi:MAG: transposase, partial [Nitrospinae bacterium]|nr:transposase [Nitrospinota bacterium]
MSKNINHLNFDQLLEGVKTMSDFDSVMNAMYKQGIHHLLESEMSHFLGYDKYESSGINSGNSRNGTSLKKLKSSEGSIQINVPRDRNSEFEPCIVPKGQSTTEKIEQVISNLLSNAIKFSKSGTIFLSLRRDRNHLTFTIADEGPGIEKRYLNHIFDKFIQCHKNSGSGLGLAIARSWIEAHRGKIWAESKGLGFGST